MKAGRLTRTPSAKVRARALVDLLQGLQLRAKTGIARKQLLQDARSYVPLILEAPRKTLLKDAEATPSP